MPFYGESSFMMYNKKMFADAGVTMPANPTWAQIATLAAKLNNPSKGVAGICLRGLTGWGDNLAALDTVVNTLGGQWFDTSWNAHLTDPAFEAAVNFYVNLIKKDGEKGAGNDSFNECLNIMEQRQGGDVVRRDCCGLHRRRTRQPDPGQVGFAPAPVDKTTASGWLWSWALALEGASKNKHAAWAVHGLGNVEVVHRLRRGARTAGRRSRPERAPRPTRTPTTRRPRRTSPR